ncbi:GlcG/HbpS family heme-binding protein [Marinospirillum perlucidum]|uniref:GlcG/HbpS family heme-binding protein n=1 Tax=Marinospirillum perlucidum TaxID=1982602 RepID=UPI000DF4A2B2|nr:heme-binding protein [Marinospirillum perlucidum]
MHSLTRQTTSLNLKAARLLADRVLEEAEHLGKDIALTLLDASGLAILRLKMDSAPEPSQEIALRKARTALAFSTPTHLWDERFDKVSPGAKTGLPLQEGLAFFGGGVPLKLGEIQVGALGISGASEAEDTQLAESAAEYLQELSKG